MAPELGPLVEGANMAAGASEPYAPRPASPQAPAGRHARTGEPAEREFDFTRPFEIDLGRAALIAEVLRECGYPLCTADMVTAELAKPDGERTNIGRFAADALARAGWRP
jgi:hypothetical protein